MSVLKKLKGLLLSHSGRSRAMRKSRKAAFAWACVPLELEPRLLMSGVVRALDQGSAAAERQVQLPGWRGVNLDPFHIHTIGTDRNSMTEYIKTLKDLGANGVRWHVYPINVPSADPADVARLNKRHLEEVIFPKLDAFLAEIKRQGGGIRVIVDLANPPQEPANAESHNVFSADPKVRARAQDWTARTWTQIARHYKGHPLIKGFDLLNEPKTNDGSSWNTLAARLINAIRKEDSDRVIYVEPRYGSVANIADLRKLLRDFSGLRVSVNLYSPLSYTHQGLKDSVSQEIRPEQAYGREVRKELRKDIRTLVAFRESAGVPILIGEFSTVVNAPNSEQYLTLGHELLNRNGFDWATLSYHARDPGNPADQMHAAPDPFDHEGRNPASWAVIDVGFDGKRAIPIN